MNGGFITKRLTKRNTFKLEPQNVWNFPYPVRIRWIKLLDFATFIYITG